MAPIRALIVAEPGASAQEVGRALRATGIEVENSRPAHLPEPKDACPDILLVCASLGLEKVSLLGRHFTVGGHTPTTVVFPADDFAALEACVLGGFDYIMPPFLPGLVRSRLTSPRDRRRLTMTVEEMATAARLLGYEKEMSVARDIQAGFLPEDLATPQDWEVAARFRPAKQVGGDLYDVFELINGRRLAFVVADVCDKGVGAALFMALIRTLLRYTAEHASSWNLNESDLVVAVDEMAGAEAELPPLLPIGAGMALPPWLSISAGPLVQAVIGTNRYLTRHHLQQGYFATMFFGVVDPLSGSLLYINGGHNPPVLIRADGGYDLLRPTGPAVGMLLDSTYSLGHVSLDPGDTLLLYTDGVTEARDAGGKLFGLDRVVTLATASGQKADGLLSLIDRALQDYVGVADQSDDITMLAIRRQFA